MRVGGPRLEKARSDSGSNPVLTAIDSAPLVEGEPTEEERAQIAEWEAGGRKTVDGRDVSAAVAALRET